MYLVCGDELAAMKDISGVITARNELNWMNCKNKRVVLLNISMLTFSLWACTVSIQLKSSLTKLLPPPWMGHCDVPCSWRPCSLQLCRGSWQRLCRLCGWSRPAGRPESAACTPAGGAPRCSAPSAYLKPASFWGSSGLTGCTLKHTSDRNEWIIQPICSVFCSESHGLTGRWGHYFHFSWTFWGLLINVSLKAELQNSFLTLETGQSLVFTWYLSLGISSLHTLMM